MPWHLRPPAAYKSPIARTARKQCFRLAFSIGGQFRSPSTRRNRLFTPNSSLKRLSKCASVTNPIGTGFFAIPQCDEHPELSHSGKCVYVNVYRGLSHL